MVLAVLARHADDRVECWPSVERLAAQTGLRRRAVQVALSRLEKTGEITRRAAAGKTSTYLVRCARGCAPDEQGGAPTCAPGAHADAPRTRPKNKTQEPDPENKKSQADAAAVLPAALDCERFKEAWAAWVKYRREIRKALKPSTVARQLEELATVGPERAAEALETAVTRGWVGYHLDNAKGGTSNARKPTSVGPGQRHPADRRDQPGTF